MLKKKLKLLKNQAGLTLVELLAVIVILGVIAAIAVPAIGGVIASSKTNADRESETLLRETAIRYMIDQDPDGNGLLADGTTAVPGYASGVVTATQLQTSGYLRSVPRKQSVATTNNYNGIPVTYSATNGWTSPTATDITLN
ncbi:MAG: prepilin-type N-terminal cleavage/methylation protein [Paenibacillus sp.]|jgi:type IV pilus assembly protein PilA|nr:prepilin-type N-terminal cleavage/methylation protein [Paenibacillus sp.]